MKITRIILVLVFLAVLAVYTVQDAFTRDDHAGVPPVLTCDSEILEISAGDGDSALLTGITATDAQDGDLTDRVMVSGVSRLIDDNIARITYVVFDSDNNMASLTRQIRYTDYRLPRFSLNEPLIYTNTESFRLLDRLHAEDVVDGDITNAIRVSYLSSDSHNNIHTIDVQVTNSMGDTAWQVLPVILLERRDNWIDVTLDTYLVYLNQGSSFDARRYLESASLNGEPISLENVTISGDVDTRTPGTYMVEYNCVYGSRSGTAVLTVVVE